VIDHPSRDSGSGADRRGVLLPELLTTLVLSAFVLSALLTALIGLTRWMESLVLRSELQELVRTVWVILDEEITPGVPGRDWQIEGESAIRLRAFRGYGRVCGSPDAVGAAAVAWKGLRLPDPTRDSVLVLSLDGGWRPAPLLGVGGTQGRCDLVAGEREAVWEWDGEGIPTAVLIRFFERGRLSLEDGALRYRRGDGGRQPLTLERLDGTSRFHSLGWALGVELVTSAVGELPPRRFEWIVARTAELP
jgi:hypothetical protein